MKTVDEAHAAGAADGRAGRGAVAPRDPKLKAAYMASYRDNLVARVGIPERRKNPTSEVRPTRSDAWLQGLHDGFNFRAKRLKKSYSPEQKQQYKEGFKTGRDRAEGKDDGRLSNPRRVVLYASRPGMRRLKYLGRGKFGERGRPMLFETAVHAQLAAKILKDTHPAALRGWTLKPAT